MLEPRQNPTAPFQVEREQPWSIRRYCHGHERRWRRLLDLHSLTEAWITDLKLWSENTDVPTLRRVLAPQAQRDFELLQRTHPSRWDSNRDALLMDQYPEEALRHLEVSIPTIQAILLQRLLAETAEEELPALRASLEQSSWAAGRACSARRWPSVTLPAVTDVRGLFTALLDSPFFEEARRPVLERALPHSVSAILLDCPHQSGQPEIRGVADILCDLRVHMMRGFLYPLQSRLVIVRSITAGPPVGCRLQFGLHSSTAPTGDRSSGH